MKQVFIGGIGAVSPAGWDLDSLRQALARATPLPPTPLERPGWDRPLSARRVPGSAPAALNHARLRRTSPISLFAASAALEALGPDSQTWKDKAARLGIVMAVSVGCVQFSRRFYAETIRDPTTASPVIFPETVFNAPASHLAAILQTAAINYTLVGDPGAFLQALAIGAGWLLEDKADGCLVVGAEELDWLTADAERHFSRRLVCAEGAGALYLCSAPPRAPAIGVELIAITWPHLYLNGRSRMDATRYMAAELAPPAPNTLLCDSRKGLRGQDAAETAAWAGWTGPQISPLAILGEGLMAGAAWQCVGAVDFIQRGQYGGALVSVAGTHQQTIGASFARVC